jgi:hypothetical protein
MRAVLLLLSMLAIGAIAKNQIYAGDEVSLDWEGNSGKIKVRRTGTSGDKESSMEISFDTLEEQDKNGKKAGDSYSFKTTDFNWTTPTQETINGKKAIKVSLKSTLENKAKFEVQSWLYQEESEVKSGDATITVKKNHVKFSVFVEDWPFKTGADQKLHFGAAVKFKGGKSDKFPDKAEDKNKDEKTVVIGPGSLDILNFAMVDGVQKDITATVVNSGAFTGVTFDFPRFDDKLEYDPVFGLDNSARSLAPGLAALLSIAVAVLASKLF